MQPEQSHLNNTDEQPQPSIQPVPAPTQPSPPTYTPQQQTPTQQPAEDPGKLFNILGVIFAFIFLQLPGLILSIIGLRKSKKAGYPTTLAIVGICLNVVSMLAIIGFLAAITFFAYHGVQERSNDATRQQNAQSIIKTAEVHNAEFGMYPTIDQLRAQGTESHKTQTTLETTTLVDTNQPTGDQIGYLACKDATDTVTGADIYIYLQTERHVEYVGSVGICEMSTE